MVSNHSMHAVNWTKLGWWLPLGCQVEIFVPVVVGVAVVVCFRSCLIGLAVTAGTLGFRISVCLKLLTLSDGKHVNKNNSDFKKNMAMVVKRVLERRTLAREQKKFISSYSVLTKFSRFANQVWLLVDLYGRTSRRSWNKQKHYLFVTCYQLLFDCP